MLTAHFQKGDKVEVRGGDDSSRWFSATVLRSSPTKHKGMIYVEYETITAGEKRRREYVAVASVRPSPPAEFHRSFKVGEKVDALHESAWRVGSVVDVLENSRYSMSFDGVVEESAFEQWNLRVHRDWDDGLWNPPFDSQMKPRALKLRIKFSGRTSDASFSKGTVVEVRSGREGYQSSWYAAVIVDSIGTDKFLVEYQTLRAGDETELKENVDASYIRPCPPEIPQMDRFKQFQDVDAWCNDGWWEALIFEVLDDHKYLVYLMGTNGEMTAEHSELRPHQEWIGGKWVAASMRTSGLKLKSRERERKFKVKDGGRISEAKFSEGTVVEVKSNEEGYQGSWFTAVIVGSIPKDKFLVQYQTLKTDDETELLKERVDASCIRPCPSVIQRVDRFKLFEKVDAWYNDGWWVGLISRVLGGLNYTVYFWTTNEELEFGHFSLRPHQEWIGGKWIIDFLNKSSLLSLKPRPGKLKRRNGLITLEANYFSKGMKVEVKRDEEGYSGSWYPAVIIGTKGTGKYLVEYITLRADNEVKRLNEEADALCIRPCPPVIQRRDPFEPFDEVDAWYNAAWWAGGVCKVLQGSKFAVYIKGTNEVLEFQHSDLRPHQDWIDGKWVIPCRGRKL
ncbi:DUF724 domain-containing protein [Actinidia chinensis var. chinensis]|uniref:DUF724 domain-containing protein n=1 Tax=Actinidia chinensis var. chinensis TaxID=1590841 RepID=A0A2R6P455_ACTCC|nr:DUF724 domain-containing protein [Actinidia chinensis var. chinensis]